MRAMRRRLGCCAASAGVGLTALWVVFSFSPNLLGQGGQGPTARGFAIEAGWRLPPGGPTPRLADGHPDFTGLYYPNRAGRFVNNSTPGEGAIDAKRQYDPKVMPQENEVFRPETKVKYKAPTPYGSCAPGGTPTSITTQATENQPVQLISLPGTVWVLSSFPQTIRRIPTDGSSHPPDPDITFNGDSRGHWEGDALVVDTIAIDTRMRNISVGATGDANAWTHSEQEHVIERFSRPSKNFLSYQVTVEDPVVLAKPFVGVPHTWTLAQRPDDVFQEYLCTDNQEPDFWKNADPQYKHEYETGTGRFAPGAERGGQ